MFNLPKLPSKSNDKNNRQWPLAVSLKPRLGVTKIFLIICSKVIDFLKRERNISRGK